MVFQKSSTSEQAQIDLATQLYKYQNFKSSVIPSKVQSDTYQTSSIIAFHSLLRKYVHTGAKDLQRALPQFYTAIDELKAKCYSTLRPSEDEAARAFINHDHNNKSKKVKVTKIEADLPKSDKIDDKTVKISADTLEKIKANTRQTYVGLRNGDQIRLFSNKDEMSGYVKAYEDNNLQITFDKVKITIESL